MQLFLSQQNILDRLLGWWYAIAASPEVSEDAALNQKIFARKSRFTSIILLIELVYHALYLFVVAVILPTPDAIPPIAVTLVCFIGGVILNRFGKLRIANIIAFVAIELSMCFYFITMSYQGGGLAPDIYSLLPILVSPDIIAISLFSTGVAFSLSAFNCVFVVIALAFFPKTPDMIQQLMVEGPIDYYQMVSIQAVVILVSLFWVRNTTGEMVRANQAEEMNKLMQELAIQQHEALEEKQQLEESIQQILAVHMQVANGNLSARVPFDHENVLWAVAGSLNNLLARLQSWRQDVQQLQYIEKSIQQTLDDVQQAKAQRVPLSYRKTGTILDPLLVELISDRPSDPLLYQQQEQKTPSMQALPVQEYGA
jgi:hypothetical protein